ncbi:MAG: 30S ribosome-binding factor RbfA [Candidatus Omnitrophota bacterium]|nr:30S ribosome-binding factor RbfA [Candidatus Omnitrophota bacterium]
MQGKRLDRVGHLIQMELSQLVLTRVKDPRLGFVTVTHVDVTPDVRSACVFYSVMGDDKAKKETQGVLERAAGFLQREIGSNLKLRFTPKLIFRRDDSIDMGIEIDSVLRSAKGQGSTSSEKKQ